MPTQLPSGALFSRFSFLLFLFVLFNEGFPFKVKQPKKDAFLSNGHWAFEIIHRAGGVLKLAEPGPDESDFHVVHAIAHTI